MDGDLSLSQAELGVRFSVRCQARSDALYPLNVPLACKLCRLCSAQEKLATPPYKKGDTGVERSSKFSFAQRGPFGGCLCCPTVGLCSSPWPHKQCDISLYKVLKVSVKHIQPMREQKSEKVASDCHS